MRAGSSDARGTTGEQTEAARRIQNRAGGQREDGECEWRDRPIGQTARRDEDIEENREGNPWTVECECEMCTDAATTRPAGNQQGTEKKQQREGSDVKDV